MNEFTAGGFVAFAKKGVSRTRGRLTRNPRIWLAYSKWVVREWLHLRYDWPSWHRSPKWLYLMISRLLSTGGMSHRSDFTGTEVGALYTGKMGGWSEAAFKQFVDSLGPEYDPEGWERLP